MAGVQTPVTLRVGAFLMVSFLLSASPQRDPRGVYSAPADGQPLCTLQIHVTGFRNNEGTAGGVVFASSAGWPEDRNEIHCARRISDRRSSGRGGLSGAGGAVRSCRDSRREFQHEAGPEFLRYSDGRVRVLEQSAHIYYGAVISDGCGAGTMPGDEDRHQANLQVILVAQTKEQRAISRRLRPRPHWSPPQGPLPIWRRD